MKEIISKETELTLIEKLREVASMGAWGNYMTLHYLSGKNLEDIGVTPEDIPRLIKQAEDYEQYCADIFSRKKISINEEKLKLTEQVKGKLEEILNQYNRENKSNTPDCILSEYMLNCLESFEKGIIQRDNWYNVVLQPGKKYFSSIE